MRQVFGRIGRLVRICLASRDGKRTGFLFLLVLGLELSAIYISVLLVQWSKDFFDALEQVDADAAIWQVGVFFTLISISVAQFLSADWLRKYVLIRWRRTLTESALDRWLGGKAYWTMRPGFSADSIDNPDQRIAEDCRLFTEGMLREALDLIPAIVGLFTYVALLWSLSTFPLEFTLFGSEISIPRYMVWLSFLYVFVSSVLTHLLGRPLKGLYFRQQQREADFRYGLVRTREHATEIAFSQGEAAERRDLDDRFGGVASNWRRLMNRELIQGLFTRPYFQTVLRVPMFFALPAYLAGVVTLGGLMQLAQAFSRVTNTLSWFIFSYRDLAEFVATSHRLDDLFAKSADPKLRTDAPQNLVFARARDGALHVSGVTLYTPEGRALGAVPDMTIEPGERIWVSGASGSGKTTFLASLAGLWPYGEGRIETPEATRVFLPQMAYVPATGLAQAIVYPADPTTCTSDLPATLLRQVDLDHRIDALQTDGPAAVEGLSGGERQRLALARLIAASPDWVFLDEATSALDGEAEDTLLTMLAHALPDATFIVTAHRPPKALHPYRTVELKGL